MEQTIKATDIIKAEGFDKDGNLIASLEKDGYSGHVLYVTAELDTITHNNTCKYRITNKTQGWSAWYKQASSTGLPYRIGRK